MRTRTSFVLAAVATLVAGALQSAEIDPRLVPTSQTAPCVRARRLAITLPISSACSAATRNPPRPSSP